MTWCVLLPVLVGFEVASPDKPEAPDPRAEVLYRITPQEVVDFLHAQGFATARIDNDGPVPRVRVRSEGYNVSFTLPDNGGYFYGIFVIGGTNATLERVNTFNDKHAFVRAVLGTNQDGWLLLNLELKHGVTRRTVQEHALFFLRMVPRFVRDVCE